MKKNKLYFLLIAFALLVLSLFLPYIYVTSYNRLDKTSEIIFRDEPPNMFGTTFYGFESSEFLGTIALVFTIYIIGRLTRGPLSDVILILLVLFFSLLMLFIFVMANTGWGKPIGNQLLIGYSLTFIGSIIVIVQSLIFKFKKK